MLTELKDARRAVGSSSPERPYAATALKPLLSRVTLMKK